MRSSLPGQKPHRLLLYRDRSGLPRSSPYAAASSYHERWTEVVVTHLHREAIPALVARRAADFLAAELRGQLLARDVRLVFEDRIARGRAQKHVVVRPRRFLGERIAGLRPPGGARPPAREARALPVGETAERGESAEATPPSRSPSTPPAPSSPRASTSSARWGSITPPGPTGASPASSIALASRRPGQPARRRPRRGRRAFVRPCTRPEPRLQESLRAYEPDAAEELDRTLVKNLQRAFRDFCRQRPSYAMLPVERRGDAATVPSAESAAPGAPVPSDEDSPSLDPAPGATTPAPELFPPGPLAAVELMPSPLRLECGGERHARARAVDAYGRTLEEPVVYRWCFRGRWGGSRSGRTPRAPAHRGRGAGRGDARRPGARRGERGTDRGRGRSGRRDADARGRRRHPRARAGRPPRGPLALPSRRRSLAGQRRPSRLPGDRVAARCQAALPRPPLRQGGRPESTSDPRLDGPLEQMVEVASYADRHLHRRGGRSRKGKDRDEG